MHKNYNLTTLICMDEFFSIIVELNPNIKLMTMISINDYKYTLLLGYIFNN